MEFKCSTGGWPMAQPGSRSSRAAPHQSRGSQPHTSRIPFQGELSKAFEMDQWGTRVPHGRAHLHMDAKRGEHQLRLNSVSANESSSQEPRDCIRPEVSGCSTNGGRAKLLRHGKTREGSPDASDEVLRGFHIDAMVGPFVTKGKWRRPTKTTWQFEVTY